MTCARPRILLLIPHLGGGGAERVIQLIAGHLSAEKYDVHLGLVAQSSWPLPALPTSVTIHQINATRVRNAAGALLRLVQQLRPALILSTMAHLNFMVLALRPFFPRFTKVLVRQNGMPGAMLSDLRSPTPTRIIYRILYPRADRVLCQSHAMAEDLSTCTGIQQQRISVVPNPVDLCSIRNTADNASSRWSGPGPHVLAVGRLRPEKGFDLLLNAFAALRKSLPTADLIIAGSGQLATQLKALVSSLSLADAVQFAGHVPDPSVYYPGASLFVLPSRHEGMPNALLEAAAGGLPIVTTPSCKGLLNLLHEDAGCWVASQTTSLALEYALHEALTSLHLAQRFPHSWIEQFSLETSIAAYQAVIDDVLKASQQKALA